MVKAQHLELVRQWHDRCDELQNVAERLRTRVTAEGVVLGVRGTIAELHWAESQISQLTRLLGVLSAGDR